ncbi:MAG TPA: hypothetical protein PKC28_02350, partial [Bdellovibrionales bacterium]|nr:hypothetical protein [Bdellovibrionales bacterium]
MENRIDELLHPTALTTKVFQNTGVAQAFNGCSGVTMMPESTRLVKLHYRAGGGGYRAFDQPIQMASTAWAMDADRLAGKTGAQYLQVNDDGASSSLSQSNAEYAFSFANWPKLKDLIDGNSNQYMDSVPTSSVGFNNQRLTNLADP